MRIGSFVFVLEPVLVSGQMSFHLLRRKLEIVMLVIRELRPHASSIMLTYRDRMVKASTQVPIILQQERGI